MAIPFDPLGSRLLLQSRNALTASVKCFQFLQVHFLDVAPDAAFGKRKSHPGLEVLNHSRLYLGMPGEIEVGPIGERIHQLPQPFRARRIVFFQDLGVDEHLHAQILIDLAFPLCLGQPPHGIQVVGFDPVEVVFALRIDHAKDGIRIGLAINMRHSPVVADNGDVLSFRRPSLRGSALRAAKRTQHHHRDQHDTLFHWLTALD